jgi:hypothetical protein
MEEYIIKLGALASDQTKPKPLHSEENKDYTPPDKRHSDPFCTCTEFNACCGACVKCYGGSPGGSCNSCDSDD